MNKRRRILAKHGEHLRYFVHEVLLSLFAKPLARFRQGHKHAPSVFFIAFALQQPFLLKAAQHGGNPRGRHIQSAAQLSRGHLLPAVMQKPHHRHLAAQG